MRPDQLANLRRSLISTIAYFDLFDYPLTVSELCRLRYSFPEPAGIGDCLAALDGAAMGERNGYYFLPGREAIVDSRLRRYRLAEKKFAKAKKVARLMSILPSVRLVAVCNSLAISNADVASDIDFFLVCRPGTLWTTRFLIVSALAIAGVRPKAGRSADTLCMSFFVSEDALCLEPLSLPKGDIYLKYWIATLVPIFDAGGTMDRFLHANEAWLKRDVVLRRSKLCSRRTVGWHARFLADATVNLMRRADGLARRLQLAIMPKPLSEMANKDTRVVLNDEVLKFHSVDRRAEFDRRFRDKLRSIQDTGGLVSAPEGGSPEKGAKFHSAVSAALSATTVVP